MKNLNILPALLVIFVTLGVQSCKKETTPEVYFETTSITTDRGGTPSTVYVKLSEPTNEIVEFNLESVGNDPIHLGSINQTFSWDDSVKCTVTATDAAFIDTQGHVRLGMGSTGFLLTFTPVNDNFPHAEANFALKITNAKNANVRVGSETFTYQINSAPVVNHFTSTVSLSALEHTDKGGCADTLIMKSGTYALGSFDYYKNGSGNYDLELRYNQTGGAINFQQLVVRINNAPMFATFTNNLSCSNMSVQVSFTEPETCIGQTAKNYDCSALGINLDASTTNYTHEVYGAYYTIDNGTIHITGPNSLDITGSFESNFLYY